MKISTEHQGRIYLWRKLLNDWKGKHPLYRSAWTWILLNAEWNPKGFNGLQRGQVRFSVDQAQKLWGMSPTQARRFLVACVKDGSISWEKGRPGRPATKRISEKYSRHGGISGGIFGGNNGGISGIITVLKYDEYQALPERVGGISGGNNETFHGLIKGSKSATDAVDGGPSKESTKESTKSNVPQSSASDQGKGQSLKKEPKKETDPRVKVLIDYYCTAYEPRFRVKYKVFAKDGKHFKDLLIDYPPNRLKACVDLFLDDPDEWLKDKRTIGVFFGRINQYLVQTASQQTAPTPAAFRKFPDPEARTS